MRLLLLVPHPFYQDRGTSIAVDHVLNVLSQRGDCVDVLTYHEGGGKQYPNVSIYRIPNLSFVKNIPIGFSWKKVLCDVLLFFMTVKFMVRNRYHLTHATEEAVFIALIMKWVFGVPYLYDMDSSLPQQLIEKYSWLKSMAFLLNFLERIAIQNAIAVLPVCDALADLALKYRNNNVVVVHDFPLSNQSNDSNQINLKTELGIGGQIVMYVGNLEGYQGIDLLLKSFSKVLKVIEGIDLVIIGGEERDIKAYKEKSKNLGIDSQIHFLGKRRLQDLDGYLKSADILVSPRIKGKNTPMKLYSYLWSEKPVLVTNVESHTQIVNNEVTFIADPEPEALAKGMIALLGNESLRLKLGTEGKRWVEARFNFEEFRKKINALLDKLANSTSK